MDMPDDRWMDPEWRKTRPKPGTPEYQKQQEQLTAYLTAVGTLITIFSGLENTLFGTLGALTTAPTPMALALFSDVRIDQAMNMIRRVMRARQQMFGSTAREKRIERIVTYALDQISILNGIRNHIIHHGLWPGSIENPTTTNIMRARTLDQVREISISVEDLKKMGDDALAASIILAHICFGVTYLDKLDQAFEWAEEQMKKPWLYKSPLQGSRNNKKQYKTT